MTSANDSSPKSKRAVLNFVLSVGLLLAGCGQKAVPPVASSKAEVTIAPAPVAAWQQGDKSGAIKSFLEMDWNGGSLFAAASPMSLTEDQFKGLSESERKVRADEVMTQLESWKQLANEVTKAGNDAASKGDKELAIKHFVALKQCGTALDKPEGLSIVRLVGQALKRKADTELGRLEK